MVLKNSLVSPVLPMTDTERARMFYRDTLGLKDVTPERMKEALMFEAGRGTTLVLYKRPPVTPDYTQAGFLVEDVVQTVNDLRARGVTFENYDMPGLKTVDGIATTNNDKAAWFKDSEGNTLVVSQIL
ncbi:MAG: VOC family protein [bacterium]|nr:VOC family protein [bacterium]